MKDNKYVIIKYEGKKSSSYRHTKPADAIITCVMKNTSTVFLNEEKGEMRNGNYRKHQ